MIDSIQERHEKITTECKKLILKHASLVGKRQKAQHEASVDHAMNIRGINLTIRLYNVITAQVYR